MTKIDWEAFMRRYKVSRVKQRIEMICSSLKHFDTKPDWVSSRVWMRALESKGG